MCVRECVLVCTGAHKCTCMHVSMKACWIDVCYVRGKIQAEKKEEDRNRQRKQRREADRQRTEGKGKSKQQFGLTGLFSVEYGLSSLDHILGLI